MHGRILCPDHSFCRYTLPPYKRLIFKDDICYIANVGDCRAVLSQNNGHVVTPLSLDHKPKNPMERVRVTEAGGKVY